MGKLLRLPSWGAINGTITDQADLVAYVAAHGGSSPSQLMLFSYDSPSYPAGGSTDNSVMNTSAFCMPFTGSIDELYICFQSATIGNVRIGFYGPFTNPFAPGTLNRVFQTGSVAVPATLAGQNKTVAIPIASGALTKGWYMILIQFDTSVKSFTKSTLGQPMIDALGGEAGHVYGAFDASYNFDGIQDSSGTFFQNYRSPQMMIKCTPS